MNVGERERAVRYEARAQRGSRLAPLTKLFNDNRYVELVWP